jgi:hypothetical protein
VTLFVERTSLAASSWLFPLKAALTSYVRALRWSVLFSYSGRNLHGASPVCIVLIVIAAAPVLLDRGMLAGVTLGLAISLKPQLGPALLFSSSENETSVRPLLQLGKPELCLD